MGKPEANNLRFKEWCQSFLDDIHHSDEEPRLAFWNGDFWMWDGQAWRKESPADIQDAVHLWAMNKEISSDPDVTRKITACVRAQVHIHDSRQMPFWNPPAGPSFSGWWLHMKRYTISAEKIAEGKPATECQILKTSRWFSNVALSYDWDPSATCPTILEFLKGRVNNDPELLDLLQEFGGLLLTPESKYHAALFLIGKAGSGKSTIGELYCMMLGEDNVERLQLDDFGRQFGLVATQGKLLNMVDEGYTVTPKTESILKWYIGGKPLNADRKHKDSIKLMPTARLIVCANKWPEFKDETDGIWRRILYVPMSTVVAYKDRDPDLLKTFRSEIPGFLNWCLAGLERLQRNGHFTQPKVSMKGIEVAKGLLQSQVEWAQEMLVEDPKGFISGRTLYNHYRSWCEQQGVDPLKDKEAIKEAVRNSYPKVEDAREADDTGARLRGLKGVRFKHSLEK